MPREGIGGNEPQPAEQSRAGRLGQIAKAPQRHPFDHEAHDLRHISLLENRRQRQTEKALPGLLRRQSASNLAQRIAAWTQRGLDGYGYFDNDDRAFAPEDALRLQRRLMLRITGNGWH